MSVHTNNRRLRRWNRLGLAAGISAVMVVSMVPISAGAAVDDRPWMNTALTAEERATLVVAEATTEEKIVIISGTGTNQRYARAGVPRLNVPSIANSDSALGLQASNVQGDGVTQFPSGLALASTFDGALAEQQGAGLGREAWELGINELLGPNLDLGRVPWSGRLYEGYGEDPLLVGAVGSAVAEGIQSNSIVSVGKHFNVQTQEIRRAEINETVGERAVREVFTPPWETAVNDGLGSAMCAFNRINADWACENEYLLDEVLKGDLGFEGYVIPDFNAVHSTADSANAGLDVESPNVVFWGDKLLAAIDAGEVPMSRLDDMVYRLVLQYFKLGLIDNPARGLESNPTQYQPPLGPVDTATLDANAPLAEQIGEEGGVLLKNDDGTLPLDRDAIDSIAVIGAGASQNIRGGAGVVTASDFTSIVDGITESAGVPVEFAAGIEKVGPGDMLAGPAPIAASALSSNGTEGLSAEYFNGVGFNGAPAVTRTDRTVNFLSGLANIIGGVGTPDAASLPPQFGFIGGPWSGRWTGELTAPATGTYTLSTTYQLGSARLVVDGQELISAEVSATENAVKTATISLEEGQKVSVLLEFQSAPQTFVGTTRPAIRLGWEMPEGVLTAEMAQAVKVAEQNDVAVVVVRDFNTEAADRGSLTLPQDQDRLIEAVRAVNPQTVVVSATGGAVLMPWRDEVPAILQAWYGGQAQGKAVASLLFGDVNPSGKLPVSFPAGEREHPISTVEQWPGINGVAAHTEDIYVGYRGYEEFGFTPAFEFGRGLSYTSFEYSPAVAAAVVAVGGTDATATTATLTVTNTGSVEGTEIVQAYVGNLPTDVETVDRALAGYAKVTLAPGESKEVVVPIARRVLQYWNVDTDEWVTPTGSVALEVGSSSTDIRTTGSVTVANDVTAPALTVTTDPATANGKNGWYTKPVTLAFTAVDDQDTAPVVETSVDGGEFAVQSGPLVIDTDGIHTVAARAKDAAGNVSEAIVTEVKLDSTAPTAEAKASSKKLRVSLSATDETSGVSSIQYRYQIKVGNKKVMSSWKTYRTPLLYAASKYLKIEYRAIDSAGNVSANQTYK